MTTIKELETKIADLQAALATASGIVTEAAPEAVTDPATPVVGDIIHVLKPVALAGDVRPRGSVLTVTEDLLFSTTDRAGHNSLAGLIDAGVIGRGDWPAGVRKWMSPGDPQWSFERTRDLAAANRFTDPVEREAAVAAVHRHFGPPPADWREPQPQRRSKWSY